MSPANLKTVSMFRPGRAFALTALLLLAGPQPSAAADDHAAHAAGAGAAPVKEQVAPEARQMSGTGWLPASAPIPGHMARAGAWDLMLHYNAFVGVSGQDAPTRSAEGFTSNWIMGMARREAAGTLTLRGMLSVEEPPLGAEGYPLVLQTGETANGLPLVDRQHPHDLFMEVAVSYLRPLGDRVGLDLYAAAVGEPALGPAAFPHRPSAATDPMAALGHHWQDSSHISFGVATVGLYTRRVKVEGSLFNGREPDESRTDFDFGPLDSYSARLTVNPSANWSMQASYGYLTEPESLEHGLDVRRTTASVSHSRPVRDGNWSSSLIWGRNAPVGQRASAAFLAETSWTRGPHAVFGRAEYVQKTGHDFALEGGDHHARLPVKAVSAGYSRRVARIGEVDLALGGRLGLGFVSGPLTGRYGTERPASGAFFLQIRPAGPAGPASHHGHGASPRPGV